MRLLRILSVEDRLIVVSMVIPWYEEFAAPARVWYYTTSGPMLAHTPVWIILTSGGCMFATATMALELYRP